ncbi:hypothetical protein HDV04_001882 [Boothiomyces sp. JEL0838]|nr:hypothetical protein HDV04_001882 [Boothiomyces sp. JEL0838]
MLNDLPTEILTQIFKIVAASYPNGIFVLNQVNSRFRDILDEHKYIWDPVGIKLIKQDAQFEEGSHFDELYVDREYLIFTAISFDNPKVLMALIKAGYDINQAMDNIGLTPLHLAVLLDCMPTFDGFIFDFENVDLNLIKFDRTKFLIDHGADVNATTRIGMTPLHLAADQGRLEICQLLVRSNSQVDAATTIDGQTPLHKAAKLVHDQSVKTAELLLKHGANVHCRDHHGYTPLHLAVIHSNVEMCKLFFEWEAFPDMLDVDGASPLHHASFHGRKEICKLLVEHGANIHLPDSLGYTPLDYTKKQDIQLTAIEPEILKTEMPKRSAYSIGAQAVSIPEQKTFEDGKPFPLVLQPTDLVKTKQDMLKWAAEHKESLALELREQGAILFRGFPITSAVDFSDFVEALGIENLPYVGGAAVRHQIYKGVHTTNESPADQPIPFHHEMAQVPKYPECLFFQCQQITKGGETPLLKSDVIYERVNKQYPEFTRKLEEKGVVYTRVIPKHDDPTSPIGRGWISTFQSEDLKVVEEKAATLGVSLIPLENGDIKTVSPVLPAIKTLPKVHNKKVWFNSVIAAYTGSEDSRNTGEKAVTFGDGEKLNREHVLGTAKLMEENAVAVPWQFGDVFWIDNNQVLHSRKAGFEQPRKIQAFLGQTNPYAHLV